MTGSLVAAQMRAPSSAISPYEIRPASGAPRREAETQKPLCAAAGEGAGQVAARFRARARNASTLHLSAYHEAKLEAGALNQPRAQAVVRARPLLRRRAVSRAAGQLRA